LTKALQFWQTVFSTHCNSFPVIADKITFLSFWGAKSNFYPGCNLLSWRHCLSAGFKEPFQAR